MLKAIIRKSIFAMLCFIVSPYSAGAQVAPTSTATISGSVSDASGQPVTKAKISLTGPKFASAQTDARGLFFFVGMPFGTYQVTATASGLGTATRSILVENDTNIAIQYEPTSVHGLKTIAQVSSSTNAQFNVTPASITQVNPIANAFEGKTSWRTILEQIPGVAQAGLGRGNTVFAAFPDGPEVPVEISINGALPYETATLMDDMPLIGQTIGQAANTTFIAGAGTDLGFYPLDAFNAADIVRGPGASAPSIVDSIGGSFLLSPPGAISKNHYNVSFSTDPYGGIVAHALAAMRWNKLSAVLTYGVNDSPGPLSGMGIPADTQFTPTTINGRAFNCTGSCSETALLSPNYANASFPFYAFQTGLLTCCVDQSTAWNQHSGSLALSYAISPLASIELFYAGQSSAMGLPYSDEVVNFVTPPGYSGSLSAGQYIFSCIGDTLTSSPFQTGSSLFEEKIVAQLGHGVLRLAALQNRTSITSDFTTPSSANLRLFGGGMLCSDTSPGCSTGTYGATVFNGATYTLAYPTDHLSEGYWSNNRDLMLSYATPLGANFHAGASFVKSYYNNPSQLNIALGAPFNFVFSEPGSAAISQTTKEFRIFAGGNLSEKTSFDLSMYFVDADYHVPDPNGGAPQCIISFSGGVLHIDFSQPSAYIDARYSYAAPRLGFVWRPTASVAVRAAAGGGFAEAPLSELIGSNGAPDCSGGVYCTVTLTNTSLQPEKSFSFDLGTDIRLRRNTILSFDVYRSNLYGQIYTSTSVTGTCSSCLGLPLKTTQYGNLGVSRFEGVLVDLRHDVSRGLYWSLSGGLTRGYLVSVPAGFYNTAGGPCIPSTGANCQNLTVVPNVNFNGTFAASIPYAQALGTLGYRWNSEKYINLVGTYYGNNNTYFRPAFVELDGHVGYPVTKNVSLLVTFRNITGIYDSPVQLYTPGRIGLPTISGLPYPAYPEQYGPRTLLLTTNVRFQ